MGLNNWSLVRHLRQTYLVDDRNFTGPHSALRPRVLTAQHVRFHLLSLCDGETHVKILVHRLTHQYVTGGRFETDQPIPGLTSVKSAPTLTG